MNSRRIKSIVLAILLLAFIQADAQIRKQLFDSGWKFHKGELSEQAGKSDFDDSTWRNVNLPHDWSIEGAPAKDEPSGNDGGYRPTGKGWYRKTFELAKTDELYKNASAYILKVFT